MNNKDFIAELSYRLGYSAQETTQLLNSTFQLLSDQLEEGNSVAIQGFGSFEVRKKTERILVNPATQQRMLVPPKLVVSFKPSSQTKEKFK